MGYIYILSKELNIIDFARRKSDRYNILNKISNGAISEIEENQLILLDINIKKIEENIISMLENRNNINNLDYKGRFQEDEVFNQLDFNNKTYLLCNSGYDNQIIFLINIFNYLKLNNKIYFLKVKKLKECGDFINSFKEF